MSIYDALFTQEPDPQGETLSAEECTELSAFLAAKAEKQVAADSIVAALEKHLAGRRLAEAVKREREHYKRLHDVAGCELCQSLWGHGVCEQHDKNRGDL